MSREVLSESDEKKIRALLLGRRIVGAEVGDFPVPAVHRKWSWQASASGRLSLDDGTEVFVIPNQAACICGAGDYDLKHLATVDNVITDVRLAEESGAENEWETAYRIYVVADAVEINALSVEGDDGNGNYGTGYELIVVSA